MPSTLKQAVRHLGFAAVTLGAALWLTPLAPETAAAAAQSCTLTKTKWLVVSLGTSTTSGTFVPVQGTSVSFAQSSPGCVIVHFSAEAGTGTGVTMGVQAVLDPATLDLVASPADNAFSLNDTGLADRAMSYVFASVPAGRHVIQMQFRNATGDNSAVFLTQRTMIVQYQ